MSDLKRRHERRRKVSWYWGVLFIFLFSFLVFTGSASAANIVHNGDFEIMNSAGLPDGWIKGRWGTNTTVFQYPVSGVGGSRAAHVSISSYTSGDAKWAFSHVPLTAGRVYTYSNDYMSSVPTYVTAQFKMTSGAFVYKDLAVLPASASFQHTSISFTAPAGVESVSVFHLVKQVGFLTLDTVALEDTMVSDPGNLISNPSLEVIDSADKPSAWATGKWGTNTASFVYPIAGYVSEKAARVSITSYTSGDAKWYFANVPVTPGASYEFSNFSKSNIATFVTVQLKKTDGTFSYMDLGSVAPSSGWHQFTKTFLVPSGIVSATVFHVIKGVGTLDVDAYSLKKIPDDPNAFDKGYISFNFDDGYRSAYDIVLPMFEAANFTSTHFIVTSRLEIGDFPGYIKPNEVLDMQAQGHEIGAHTRTHPDLTTLTTEESRIEIEGSRQDLFDIGATPVDFFAYPFGAYNNQVKQQVKNAGFAGARASNGGFNKKNTDIYLLQRQLVKSNTTFAEVKGYIDKAATDKTWLILLFHDIANDGAEFSTTPAILQQIVDYVKSKNMAPITLGEGLERIQQ